MMSDDDHRAYRVPELIPVAGEISAWLTQRSRELIAETTVSDVQWLQTDCNAISCRSLIDPRDAIVL